MSGFLLHTIRIVRLVLFISFVASRSAQKDIPKSRLTLNYGIIRHGVSVAPYHGYAAIWLRRGHGAFFSVVVSKGKRCLFVYLSPYCLSISLFNFLFFSLIRLGSPNPGGKDLVGTEFPPPNVMYSAYWSVLSCDSKKISHPVRSKKKKKKKNLASVPCCTLR
jgi:hypothetical protein